jgi:hypothetical protein
LTSPSQHATCARSGKSATVNGDRAIDDHVRNSRRILVRLLKRREIGDRVRMEDRYVCAGADAYRAAVRESKRRRGHSRHLVDSALEREDTALANIPRKHARERAVRARMRVTVSRA